MDILEKRYSLQSCQSPAENWIHMQDINYPELIQLIQIVTILK